jgi:hypothetical protein
MQRFTDAFRTFDRLSYALDPAAMDLPSYDRFTNPIERFANHPRRRTAHMLVGAGLPGSALKDTFHGSRKNSGSAGGWRSHLNTTRKLLVASACVRSHLLKQLP